MTLERKIALASARLAAATKRLPRRDGVQVIAKPSVPRSPAPKRKEAA